MFKEVLEWFLKIKSRPLLVVFLAVTISTSFPKLSPLDDPFSPISFLIPLFVIMAYLVVIAWIGFVIRLNCGLSDYDLGNWGLFIGGSGLAYCLCIVFWYVSNTPDPLNLKVLGDVNFVRLFTFYLLSVETMNVPRYAIK